MKLESEAHLSKNKQENAKLIVYFNFIALCAAFFICGIIFEEILSGQRDDWVSLIFALSWNIFALFLLQARRKSNV